MSFFDLNPKESPKALFGRERELDDLVRLVDSGRWTAVLGPRMAGKTSLIKAANRRLRNPAVYVNLWGAKGTAGLIGALVNGLDTSQGWVAKLRERLRQVEGVTIGASGLSIAAPNRSMKTLWDVMRVITSRAEGCVIELDEVQELYAMAGPLSKLLGNIFNTSPRTIFVFSGSMFGLMRTLLEPKASSPLMGRSPARIELGPFTREQSIDFLRRGFQEADRSFDEEAGERVVAELGGTPGWLTLYGNAAAVQRMPPEEALAYAIKEASAVARDELHHFLSGRDRKVYLSALRTLARGARWVELREDLAALRGGPVNDASVRGILRALKSFDLISETDGEYTVPDPILRRVLLRAS
ncbi:MAG: ATP-binding protein [Euryarchaeota archaeon]|nr:ATP-binding protein [Euryarchaeota archaeon]MDE1838094.1 ATP-binding protein [Euryarchaeota archaeon]MDE2046554.1 ATP-binding protein [Thermoplasmata archaeon]